MNLKNIFFLIRRNTGNIFLVMAVILGISIFVYGIKYFRKDSKLETCNLKNPIPSKLEDPILISSNPADEGLSKTDSSDDEAENVAPAPVEDVWEEDEYSKSANEYALKEQEEEEAYNEWMFDFEEDISWEDFKASRGITTSYVL